MTLALKITALFLLVVAVLGIVATAGAVSVPPAPRLGHRGAERRRAMAAAGLFAAAEPLIRFVAGTLGSLELGRLRAHQEYELRRADYCLGLTPDEYSALSVLASLALAASVGAIALVAHWSVALAVPAGALGLILPKLQIQEIIRQRTKEISRGLPHAIEIAAMCMGAGLDFPSAMRLIAEPRAGSGRSTPLAREFAQILEELDLGHTRKQALLGFASRVPTVPVQDLVSAIVQAEQKGSPLARVIQVQGRMLNMRRSVAAEEAAARAGVLMIAPMMLLVGCILLLLLGPILVKGIGF
jgi:tight adherence protein C